MCAIAPTRISLHERVLNFGIVAAFSISWPFAANELVRGKPMTELARRPDPAALRIAALAAGALAAGAIAIGVLAIARLAVGKLVVRDARFRNVAIDELTVRRLRVLEGADAAPRPHDTM
jgi:hypothetical protein